MENDVAPSPEDGIPPGAPTADTAKIMTMYITLLAVKRGDISLDDPVVICKEAADERDILDSDGGTTLDFGDDMSLEDALYAIAKRHNQTTAAVAEVVVNAVLYGDIHPARALRDQ